MIRETKTDGVSAMFTRLVKSLSVVVLIFVLASSVSLAGVGVVGRGGSAQYSSHSTTDALWSLVLSSIRLLPMV